MAFLLQTSLKLGRFRSSGAYSPNGTASTVALRKSFALPLELVHLQRLIKRDGSKAEKCEVPQLDPWDPSIKKYYKKVSPLKCSSLQEDMTVLKDGVLRVLEEYRNEVNCRCRTFEFNEGVSDFKVKYDSWLDVDPVQGLSITKDFVEVECYSKGLLSANKYKFYWNQIVKRDKSLLTGRPFEKSSEERPSVLIFGIDSMSRSNFIRALPKTKHVMEQMGFVDMLGHVKIGDNTYPNWMAMLTGKRSPATREFEAELPDDSDAYFDEWPLIWKNYSRANYTVLFAEDRPQIATFALLKRHGFNSTPADHYMRPYWLEAYWSLLGRRSDPWCYDKFPMHVLQLNYLNEFVQKYNGIRSFAFYWITDLAHNFVNQVGVADDDFANFLESNRKNFENSIVLMLSDHGNRYDRILETVVGRTESRLPYLSILLPEKLQAKYPHIKKNLQENSHKMTTQFDTHSTLVGILEGNFQDRTEAPKEKQRAYSMFHKMPDLRTCFEANIPEDYCPCVSEVEIPKSESCEPAEKLIGFINEDFAEVNKNKIKIKDGFECLHLEVETVEYASVRLPPSGLIGDLQAAQSTSSDRFKLRYHIIVKAKKPSEALLEGVVIKDLNSGEWTTTGEIERNNKYGNTSHCITDTQLQKTCYCIESLTAR